MARSLPIVISIYVLVSLAFAPAGEPSSGSPTKRSHGSSASVKANIAKAREKEPEKANAGANSPPFTNNHYVLTSTMSMNGYHAENPTVAIVDKGSHSTYVLQLQKDKIARVLTVSNAIGTTEKPTPPGRYRVLRKEKFPRWIPPATIDKKQKPVAPYNETHKNPLGVAAIFLDKDELALHGTNAPAQIRKSASHGCVRHSNADISRLYGMVERGDTVMIVRQFRGTVLNRSDFKSRAPKHS